MTTLAVIQARMGSTRFPGKVLAHLQGRPMLAHVIERARRAAEVDGVVVATTIEAADDAVASLAATAGAMVTRGSVDDVLGRFVLAVREHGADVVARITADCPLVDPDVIDLVARRRAAAGAEYAGNVAPATYPDGYDVEVFTRACLERLDREAMAKHEREHVTARVREHPGDYVVVNVTHQPDLSSIRLTVDVPADLERIATLLSALPATPPPGLDAVLASLREHATLTDQTGLPQRDERYRAQREATLRQETSG